jgi:hypothetical protein
MIWPNEGNALTYAGLRAPRRILWQSRDSGVVRGLTLVAHRKRVAQAKRIDQRIFKAWDRNAHAFIWYEGREPSWEKRLLISSNQETQLNIISPEPLPEVAHDS